ncbi:MAG: M23 family metallopeptidase [Candidatus Thorarchaeota archaeon]
MKKLYYFSEEKTQFIEIKNLKSKFYILIPTLIIILGFTIFVAGKYFESGYPKEHNNLKKKVDEILTLYKNLNTELDSITSKNNSLRVAVNLSPLSRDEMQVGIGGGSFDNSIDFFSGDKDMKLDQAVSFVDEVSRKLSFEKAQFEEIKNQLSNNQKLSACIPAIKPCGGDLSDRFGMRMHPILHRLRMHEGIDIVTNVGTPIHVTGDGVVAFTGYNGGFGLSVIVKHGYGYRTIYAHLSKVKVKRGTRLHRGDIVGLSGSTGLSTGPHLHYEVEHNGVKLNPEHFFFKKFNYFADLAQK